MHPEIEKRPFVQKTWLGLTDVATANWSSPAVLQSTLAELKFRRTKRAGEVRTKVTQRLEEMSREAFLWPKTAVMDAKRAMDTDQFWYEHGLLKFLGYQVGQKGALKTERWSILDYVYNNDILPRVHSVEYMDEWGKAKTGRRLKKMADSLATFARNAKRKRRDGERRSGEPSGLSL